MYILLTGYTITVLEELSFSDLQYSATHTYGFGKIQSHLKLPDLAQQALIKRVCRPVQFWVLFHFSIKLTCY